MKKLVAYLIALTMTLALTACGGDSGGTTGAPMPTPPPSDSSTTQDPASPNETTPSSGDDLPDTSDIIPDDSDQANDDGSGWSSGVFNADDVQAEDFTFTKSISGDTITITVYDKNLREDYAITEDRLSYGFTVYAFGGNYSYSVLIFSASSSSDNPGVLEESRFFARDYGENALNIDYEQRKITFAVKLDRLLEPGVDESWNDYEWMLEASYSVERFEGDLALDVQSSGRMQIYETQ
jgi:uncharacterized lipoprotein YehR (DUF1307 family)